MISPWIIANCRRAQQGGRVILRNLIPANMMPVTATNLLRHRPIAHQVDRASLMLQSLVQLPDNRDDAARHPLSMSMNHPRNRILTQIQIRRLCDGMTWTRLRNTLCQIARMKTRPSLTMNSLLRSHRWKLKTLPNGQSRLPSFPLAAVCLPHTLPLKADTDLCLHSPQSQPGRWHRSLRGLTGVLGKVCCLMNVSFSSAPV